MKTKLWALALLTACQMSVIAQPFDNLIPTIVRVKEISIGYQANIKTSETTTKTDGGKRITTTKTETDTKTGHIVKKTTTTTDYTEREGHPNRKEKKKVTEVEIRESDGSGQNRTTTTEETTAGGGRKTTVTKDPAGQSPKRTVSVEEKNPDGSSKKTDYHDAPGNNKKSETEYGPDGKPIKTTKWNDKGQKTEEIEYDKDGKEKKSTMFGEDGKPYLELSDYDERGRPRKAKTFYPNGQKKTEEDLDDLGGTKERREYDEKGRLIKKISQNGDVETIIYNADGSIRRTTVRHKDGSTEETEYEGGKPKRTTKRDSQGRPISNVDPLRNWDAENAIIIAPNTVEAGQAFQFTVATLSGQVIANTPVILDGGAMGKVEATTDLNGIVTAKAPDNWKNVKIVLGGLATTMIINSFKGSPGAPAIINPPQFIQPGSIVNIPCNGMPGTIAGQTVMFGDMPGKVLGASSTSVKVLMPTNAPIGNTQVTVNANGKDFSFDACAVKLRWDSNQPKMVVGQTSIRTLIVEGTDKPIDVYIEDRMNDAVTVQNVGKLRTSGGARNTVSVRFIANSIGSFTIPATCPTGNTEYEKDLEKAEAAKKDAAGWEDSAKTQTNDDLKEAFNNAARNMKLAAYNWGAAADARMHGNDAKAEELEAAARDREEAAKAYAEKDWSKAKAAEASAKMHENNAKDK